jgi:hypothetical protein
MSYFADPDRLKALATAIEEDTTMAPKFAPVIDNANVTANEGNHTMNKTAPVIAGSAANAGKAGEFQKFAGIPLPEARSSRESKYGWDELAQGESFFVPGAKPDTFNTLTSTRNKREKEKNGDKAKKFVARKFTHEGVVGVMVWRTE